MWVDVANASLLENDPTGALQNLVTAEQEDPTLPSIYHTRALALYAKHDVPGALASARKAIKLAPAWPDANNTLGKILMESGASGEAIPYLTTAADNHLYREAFKPMTNLGILYYRQGEMAKSRDYLNQAILVAPESACVAYYYRGHLDLKASQLKDAISDYDQATRRFCAKFGDAHVALGIALERNRDYDRARKKFLEIEQRFPDTNYAQQAMDHLRYLP